MVQKNGQEMKTEQLLHILQNYKEQGVPVSHYDTIRNYDFGLGKGLLHIAVDQPEIVTQLINVLPAQLMSDLLKSTEKFNNTAIHYAASINRHEVLRDILASVRAMGSSPLQILLTPSRYGYTAAHYAAYHNNYQAMESMLESLTDSNECLQLLISKTLLGLTVLHFAVFHNSVMTVEVLQRFMTVDHLFKLIKAQTLHTSSTVLHISIADNNLNMLKKMTDPLTDQMKLELLAIQDMKKLTPKEMAMKLGHNQVAIFLEEITYKAIYRTSGWTLQGNLVLNQPVSTNQKQELYAHSDCYIMPHYQQHAIIFNDKELVSNANNELTYLAKSLAQTGFDVSQQIWSHIDGPQIRKTCLLDTFQNFTQAKYAPKESDTAVVKTKLNNERVEGNSNLAVGKRDLWRFETPRTAQNSVMSLDETETDNSPRSSSYTDLTTDSDSSAGSTIIDQLDMEDDAKQVTIVEIKASQESYVKSSMYHIIAGYVRSSDNGASSDIRSHHLTNDKIHSEVSKRFRESLAGITEDKIEKIKANSPPYVVTSKLPSINKFGDIEIGNILQPVDIEYSEEQREVYVYKIDPDICLRLHEPRSPMRADYSNGTSTMSLLVSDDRVDGQLRQNTESLDRVNLHIFHDLRRLHKEDNCEVVTAITSVVSLGPEEPVEQHIFLVGGVLYGKGLTDTKTKPPLGWRVSLTTLLNDDISTMIKDKWTNNIGAGIPIFSCCKSGIASSMKPKDLELPRKDSAITIHWTDSSHLEIRWTELPTILCRFTKAQYPKGQQGELREPIPENLLSTHTYIGALNINGGVDQSDSESVMININMLKTLLRYNRKGQVKGMGYAKSEILIIMAVGNENTVHIPKDFRYHDPVNVWQSQTSFIQCKALRQKIQTEWVSTADSELVAPHLTFTYDPEKNIIKQQRHGKARIAHLEFMCHNPKEVTAENNVLHMALSNNKVFTAACRDWSYINNCLDLYRSRFFNPDVTPTTYRFATAKFKHCGLERPNQLGVFGVLVLLFHNAAHIKFTTAQAKAKEVGDDDMKDCIVKTKAQIRR